MTKLILILMVCCHAVSSQAASYAVVRSAAPVLNTSEFPSVFGGADGKTLKTDRCGQVRDLEFIALPGTVFTIRDGKSSGEHTVFRVDTDEYPTPKGTALYVDSRFVELREEKPPPRSRSLPSEAAIITALKSFAGAPYVWGGNIRSGVGELLEYFYRGDISVAARQKSTLAGLDCSGLLYQATGGWTPRNTSRLLSFGKTVPVAGRSLEEIVRSVQPLDLIVWNGHVLIVLDRGTVIESRLACGKPGNGGVVMTPLQQRLAGIMRTRRPVDDWSAAGKQKDIFVVRRWFSP